MAHKAPVGNLTRDAIIVLLVMTALYWPYEFILWLVHTI